MFSIEIQEKLKEICENRQEIQVAGLNGINQPFNCTARIAKDDNGVPGVEDKYVMLEFGKGRFDEPYHLAPYQTGTSINLETGDFDLIISEIKVDDEVLWKNEMFDKIQEITKQRAIKRYKKYESEGRLIGECDPVTKGAIELMGNLVEIDGTRGVVCNVSTVSDSGHVVVDLKNAVGVYTSFVGPTSYIFTENNKGRFQLAGLNTKEETAAIFANRKKEIEKHSGR